MARIIPSLNEWMKSSKYRVTNEYNSYADSGEDEMKFPRIRPAAAKTASSGDEPGLDSGNVDYAKKVAEAVKEFYDTQKKIKEMTDSFEKLISSFVDEKNRMSKEIVSMMKEYNLAASDVNKSLHNLNLTYRKGHTRSSLPYKTLYETLMTKVNPSTKSVMYKLERELTNTTDVGDTIAVKNVHENFLSGALDWLKATYRRVMSFLRAGKDDLIEAKMAIDSLKKLM